MSCDGLFIRLLKFKGGVLILLMLVMASLVSRGQEPVVRSKEKVMINGKTYYIHVVKKGETLYSISRAYQVTQKQIEEMNPAVRDGLKTDMSLRIPVVSGAYYDPVPGEYLLHRIGVNETAYSIARKYAVTADDIIRANPGLDIHALAIGENIRIPRKTGAPPVQRVDSVSGGYLYHWTSQKETLYSLARKYSVTVDMIREANGGLPGGLKSGAVIRIPLAVTGEPVSAEQTVETVAEPPPDSPVVIRTGEQGYNLTGICDSLLHEGFSQRLNVALMLPFYLDENAKRTVVDSTQLNEKGDRIYKVINRPADWIFPRTLNYLEFYEGALLAIDSMAQRGLSVNLHVFDTRRDSLTVMKLVRNGTLEDMDLIIGPVFTSDPSTLPVVADYARMRRIPIVSPLSPNPEILRFNPYIFQVQPSRNTEIQKAAEYLSGHLDKNLILVYSDDTTNRNMVDYFRKNLRYQASDFGLPGVVSMKEVEYNQLRPLTDSTNILMQPMVTDRQNMVIILSYDEGFVSKVLANLNTMAGKYPISVFGFSNWLQFENIELDYFYTLKIQVITNHFVDYEHKETRNFLRKYRKKYYTEPAQNSAAWDGYDIFLYFLTAIQKYGRDFSYCIRYHKMPLIHMEMQFKRKYFFDGFENDSFFVVSFEPGWKMKKTSVSATRY